MEQAASLRDKEARAWQRAELRELRGSHALQALVTWMDLV